MAAVELVLLPLEARPVVAAAKLSLDAARFLIAPSPLKLVRLAVRSYQLARELERGSRGE